MDGWNAPMWVDFDASVMSDIDEYFNVEHDELESEQAAELQYHSCPSTPNSKGSLATSPYKTPKSDSNGSSRELNDYMKTLQINAAKKLSKSKLSMTPRNYVLKKACLRSTRSSTPRIGGKPCIAPSDVEEKENKLPEVEGTMMKANPVKPAVEETRENVEPIDDEDVGEDENAEQNRTLVASAETDQSCIDRERFFSIGKVCTKAESETTKEIQESIMAKETQDSVLKNTTEESSMTKKAEDAAPTTLIKDSSMTGEGEKSAPAAVQKSSAEIAPEGENEKISIDSTVKNSDEVSIPSTKNDERANKVNEPEKKLIKSQSRVDPLRRAPLDNKKLTRSKPTVLTSHARRQSTSKYRRVSGKYVSLAEAVSKFQNGTPERFRSSNKPKSSNNPVAAAAGVPGPLQKIRQAALKVTCATSPLLRCKYRARTVTLPSKEEREILEIEEIRKNRLKPNPIKPSIMKPKKLQATTIALPGTRSKLKKPAIITGASKKIDEKKPARNPEASSSNDDPARPLKKSAEPTTVDGDAPSRFKYLIKPSKASDQIKKPTTVSDTGSSSRRTMMNPPKSSRKVNEPATTSGSLLSSRRTMANPSTPLNKIDKRSTIIPEPFSNSHKAAFKPPPQFKKPETEKTKTFAEPFPVADKKRDTSILSTSILPESARKHTPCKKTVPTVVSTDEGAAIKDVEILHFGIPVGNDYKKITKTVPFSFETRTKELRDKKEKLKNRQTEETKKPKTFQARPVPSYVIKPAANVTKAPSKPPVMPDAPFSFQQRNETLLSRKREMFEKMIEREKQARIFHAKPAPHFKPVFVRGASAENLRDNKFIDKNDKMTKETRRRGLSQSSIVENRENTAPNAVPTTQSFPKLKVPLVTQNRKLKKPAT